MRIFREEEGIYKYGIREGKKKPVGMHWNCSDWYELMISKISMYMFMIMCTYMCLYICMYVYVRVYKSIYFLVLLAEKAKKLRHSRSSEFTQCPDLGL